MFLAPVDDRRHLEVQRRLRRAVDAEQRVGLALTDLGGLRAGGRTAGLERGLEHFVRPFALSLNVLGAVISSFASVFFGSLFLMFRSIDEFFGFFFVPAFFGAILPSWSLQASARARLW